MSQYLGQVFSSGEAAPESGAYQLMHDDPKPTPRTDMGRVYRFVQGNPLPGHPDTGGPAEWRFIRVALSERLGY